MTAEVRHGRWQDVLADVRAGSVITDPPYGARTHTGALQGGEMADGRALNLTDVSRGGDGCARTPIDFACWTADDVSEFGAEMDPAAFARCQAALTGDMAAYARLAPAKDRKDDPRQPSLFGGAA